MTNEHPLDIRLQKLYPGERYGTPPNPITQVGFNRNNMHKFADSLMISELIGITKFLTVQTIQKGVYVQIVLDILAYADAEYILTIRKALQTLEKSNAPTKDNSSLDK